jgi:hypothetical protein
MGELMKGCFCVWMVCQQPKPKPQEDDEGGSTSGTGPKEGGGGVVAATKRLALTSGPMAVPALIFLVNPEGLEPPAFRLPATLPAVASDL